MFLSVTHFFLHLCNWCLHLQTHRRLSISRDYCTCCNGLHERFYKLHNCLAKFELRQLITCPREGKFSVCLVLGNIYHGKPKQARIRVLLPYLPSPGNTVLPGALTPSISFLITSALLRHEPKEGRKQSLTLLLTPSSLPDYPPPAAARQQMAPRSLILLPLHHLRHHHHLHTWCDTKRRVHS